MRHEPKGQGRKRRQSPQEAIIERQLGITAVCMISYAQRVPRHFGDNEGAWPVKFVVTQKPRNAAKIDDLASPIHKVSVRHMVNVRDKDAAKRLKNTLDSLLLGSASASKLRHGWRDVDDPDLTWDLLLGEALRTTRLEGFDEEEKTRRIQREYDRRVSKFRRRG